MSKIPKEILDVKSKSIDDLLIEWNELITELSNNEVALYEWKHVYNVRASAIEEETDFKSLYGKNNEKIRKEHVREELKDWYAIIKELEFSIDYAHRRISFLRELIKVRRARMEYKE